MARSTPAALDVAFGALADATRREVVRVLLKEPCRAGELAKFVSMSPAALSRHLRVLRRAGVVVEQSAQDDARVRIYSLNPSGFAPIQEWLDEVESLWQAQLGAFKTYAERTRSGGRKP